MKYQALYRKYRPQNFSDMVGQLHITKTIQNALKMGKISHAYLFSGPRGTGKTTTAKIIAKAVNCLNENVIEPCGTCDVCQGIQSGEISDIIEIDAASNNGVDEIREIRDKVKYAPSVCKYKVYIIDEVHMLSTGAFNALLKTLEEPPKHVIFILATTEPHKIPLTIISRCQRFDFKKITENDLVKKLNQIAINEGILIKNSALKVIAKIADGGMRDAISILDQAISYADNEVTEDDVHQISGTVSSSKIHMLINNIANNNVKEALSIIDSIYQDGKDIVRLSEDIIFYLRDLLLYRNVPNLDESVKPSKSDDLYRIISNEYIYNAIEVFNHAINEMKYTNHPKIFLELSIIKLINKEATIDKKDEREIEIRIDGVKQDTPEPKEDIKENIEEVPTLNVEEVQEEVTEHVEPEVEEITEEIVEEKEIISNDSNNDTEEVYTLEDIIDIRINNTLALAQKKILDKIKINWREMPQFAVDPVLGPIAGLLMDCNIRVASIDGLIISFPYDAMVQRVNNSLKEVEKLVELLTNQKMKVAAISDKRWVKVKDEYITHKRRGEQYLVKEEPKINYHIKKNTNNSNVDSKVKINQEPIVQDAINMFGEDLIEIK